MLHSIPLAAELRTNTYNPLHRNLVANPPLAILLRCGVIGRHTHESKFIWNEMDALGMCADAIFWLREPTPAQRSSIELALLHTPSAK